MCKVDLDFNRTTPQLCGAKSQIMLSSGRVLNIQTKQALLPVLGTYTTMQFCVMVNFLSWSFLRSVCGRNCPCNVPLPAPLHVGPSPRRPMPNSVFTYRVFETTSPKMQQGLRNAKVQSPSIWTVVNFTYTM